MHACSLRVCVHACVYSEGVCVGLCACVLSVRVCVVKWFVLSAAVSSLGSWNEC